MFTNEFNLHFIKLLSQNVGLYWTEICETQQSVNYGINVLVGMELSFTQY